MNETPDQIARWKAAIADLHVLPQSIAPPHERLPPTFRIGNDTCWKFRLADGRFGWARTYSVTVPSNPYFYVPQDVADEAWLKFAASRGYDLEWAKRQTDSNQVIRDAILRASPARQRQLHDEIKQASVSAGE